jgi:hypothetical protein
MDLIQCDVKMLASTLHKALFTSQTFSTPPSPRLELLLKAEATQNTSVPPLALTLHAEGMGRRLPSFYACWLQPIQMRGRVYIS